MARNRSSRNNQRSNSMNPNNPAYEASRDNRSNQHNPNNSSYHSSRVTDDDEEEEE